MKQIYILISLIILILISGCISTSSTKKPVVDNYRDVLLYKSFNETYTYNQPIEVIHDDQRNVTCWIKGVNNGGGISCIPDSQLNKGE